jgi:hypothetical protein
MYQKFSSGTFFKAIPLLLSTPLIHACGRYEFYLWGDLPESIQATAETLNYNEDLWNNVGTNPIEKFLLSDLFTGVVDGANEYTFGTDEKTALVTLDLYDDDSADAENCWNHFVNHYRGFAWDDLGDFELEGPFGNDIVEAVEILGWTKETWESDPAEGIVPESECKAWFQLSPDEQWAAQSLGWTGMKWMSYPLGESVALSVFASLRVYMIYSFFYYIADPRCPPFVDEE